MSIEEYFGTIQQSVVEIWKNHLQTSKYSKHKALNDYYDEAIEAIDGLIEDYQGIHGKVGELKNTIDTDFDSPKDYLEKLKDFIKDGREELIDKDDTELWSDVDEILSIIDSAMYQIKELKESMMSLVDFLTESVE